MIAMLVTLNGLGADVSWAQSSPRFRLGGGGLASCSGSASSGEHRSVGECGPGVATGRSSSISADLVGGFLYQAFSSRTSVTIATPAREFVSIAFPLKPADDGVTSVLDELGEADIASWRLGAWSPSDSTYVEAADERLTAVARGRGYFLITAEPAEVVEVGLPAPMSDFEIDLESGPNDRPGYNQLGNPFLFPVAVADLMVSDGATVLPLTSPQNTFTETQVKLYDATTGSYVSNVLAVDARTAFWVKKLAPGPVKVIVPCRAAETAAPISALALPARAEWAVAVTARQATRACEPILVGAAAVAPGEWNSLCLSRAPDPPGGALSLSLHEERWDRLSGDYVRVFRSPAESMSWDLAARGLEWPGEVSLEFESFGLPAGARMRLSDLRDGWTRELSNRQSITIAAKRDQGFRLTVALDGDAGPVATVVDGLRGVYPNPFLRRSGLVFSMRTSGAPTVRIYDVSGRRIRDLSAPESGAGERVVVWDGTDDAGRHTAPGVYLARYHVGRVQGVARLVKIE